MKTSGRWRASDGAFARSSGEELPRLAFMVPPRGRCSVGPSAGVPGTTWRWPRAGEEVGEYRCEHLGRHLVRLAREGLAFGVWERGGELRVGVVLVGLALAAVEHQRRYLQGGPLLERSRAAAAAVRHRGRVVWEGVGDRFEGGPERFLAHLLDELARNAGGGGHEVGDRVAAPICGDQLGECGLVVVGKRRPAVVDDEGRLVEREPVDREPLARRAQGEIAAGR